MIENHIVTSNIILYCRRWRESISFYGKSLELPVLFETDWFVEFGLTSTSRLSIADERRSSIKSGGGRGVTLTLEVDDIKIVRDKLDSLGIYVTELIDHPWGAWVFHVFDPEGNRIEIWQPLS